MRRPDFFNAARTRHGKTCMCRRIMMPSSYMRERERERTKGRVNQVVIFVFVR
jgi:hypothetical protein